MKKRESHHHSSWVECSQTSEQDPGLRSQWVTVGSKWGSLGSGPESCHSSCRCTGTQGWCGLGKSRWSQCR